MSIWMGTFPETEICKRKLYAFFRTQDIKKWVWCREVGKDGYRHIHVRMEWLDHSDSNAFDIWKDWFRSAHLEQARADNWDYEKKDGHYFCWDDTPGKIKQRFGRLRGIQEKVLSILDRTSDREVVLWYDTEGRAGKSFLCGALWERRKGFYAPPYLNSVRDIVQFVASGYDNEEYIVIDLPRAMKWDKSLYAGIEAIKDGLISDPRYNAKTRNIRGVKVLVMSNTKPDFDKLSLDRWVIFEPSYMVTLGTALYL